MIRISGAEAAVVADRVFRPRSGKELSKLESRRMTYGDIIYEGDVIDDGMAVVFRAPNSYTGEDTVEISCHGGVLLTQTVLEAVFAAGALPAGPGEFTKRAFLNGRLGLIKAESVIDLIDADNREGIALASAQSRGVLSGRIEELYSRMKRLVSSIYVYIDFPGEDLTDVAPDEMEKELVALGSDIDSLCQTYRTGRSVREGIAACICGKPNVGKSSLLNALLGRERAIVSSAAGTTRDVITEKLRIGRCAVILSDTAGIRAASDDIEQIGVGLAEKEMECSELIIAVFDGSAPLGVQDDEFIDKLVSVSKRFPDKKIVSVINKSDLGVKADKGYLKRRLPSAETVTLSAGSGDVSALTKLIDERFTDLSLDLTSDAIISNARQFAAVSRARSDIGMALSSLRSGFTQDVAALDIEKAMADIAEADGLAVSEDIVSDIFNRFCVGK